MSIITKDIKTVEELKTLANQGNKAAVVYDVSTGEPFGLDLEVLIGMNSSIAGLQLNKMDLTGVNSNASVINFNTSTPVVDVSIGALRWNSEIGNLQYRISEDSYIDIGEELQYRGKNAEVNTLVNGEVVYVYGSTGENLTIKRATNTDATIARKTFGVITEASITSNSVGRFCIMGSVRGLNTASYAPGTILYLGVNGGWTGTKPTASVPAIQIGIVLRQHAADGIIYFNTRRIDRIEDLSDVYIPEKNNGDVLSWNSSTGRFEGDSIITDTKAVHPEIAYTKRVIADGGTVRSMAFMQRLFEANKDLLADTELLFVPEAGMKVTDGKIEKLYNLVGTNDAVQATAANRFYAGNLIADNEKASLKMLGSASSGHSVSFTTVSFTESEDFSILLSATVNNDGTTISFGGTVVYIGINSNGVSLFNGATVVNFTGVVALGVTNHVLLTRSNSTITCIVNGVSFGSETFSSAISFNKIQPDTGYEPLASIYSLILIRIALPAYDSQKLVDFLSTGFPPIETIAVGSQQVATSNYEGTVDADGVVIPEVQNAASVELITNAADREFSSDTGWWRKAGAGVSIADGKLNFTDTAAYDTISRMAIGKVGRFYRLTYTIESISSGALVFSFGGLSPTPRTEAGTYSAIIKAEVNGDLYLYSGSNGTTAIVDNVSLEELGWSELDSPAWCYYNNDPALGAVYGKLYNGYAVEQIAAKPPKGYHVPSGLEWTQLSESLGGNTVSGGKLKAKYGGFDNANATNESGVSLLAGGYRSGGNGVFGLLDVLATPAVLDYISESQIKDAYVMKENITFAIGNTVKKEGKSIRLFSNIPHLTTDQYESGWFATDIASTQKVIKIPFGCRVKSIKTITTTSVTAIEAKLYNYAGVELETLITGKACNTTTKSFAVIADQTVSYTDNYVRVTASGNSGTQGMNIIVTIEPI